MENEVIKKLASLGIDSQLDQTQEECAELIVAISHYRRKKTQKALDNLIEEIADVTIMIRQLYFIMGYKDVEKKISEKLARSKERLENGAI
jgi:NTP pyrophosphatase (non-canonical NTP hydrolase)